MQYISVKQLTDSNLKLEENRAVLINKARVFITSIPCNYGGNRWYFICPNCSRTCYKLFFITVNIPVCNICSNANKRTLNRTKTDCCYYWRLAVKVGKKIDSSYSPPNYLPQNLVPPKKPDGMTFRKYMKYHHRFWKYVLKGNSYFGRL